MEANACEEVRVEESETTMLAAAALGKLLIDNLIDNRVCGPPGLGKSKYGLQVRLLGDRIL